MIKILILAAFIFVAMISPIIYDRILDIRDEIKRDLEDGRSFEVEYEGRNVIISYIYLDSESGFVDYMMTDHSGSQWYHTYYLGFYINFARKILKKLDH